MPKKKKGISKIKKKKVKEIKKKKKIIEIKSGLEKNIKEEDKIEEFGFSQPFTQIETNFRAPVLEKVQTQRALELNLPMNSNSRPENSENQTGVDYSASTSENEPKYNDFRKTDTSEKKYETNFSAPVLESTRIRGRNQEVLMRGTEPRIETQNNESRFETETLEQERRMPFEPEQKKYRKVKL